MEGAALRRELREHRLSVEDALVDTRAGSMTIEKLLLSVPRVGPRAIPLILKRAGVLTAAGFEDPRKLVRDLTVRQRIAVVVAVRRPR